MKRVLFISWDGPETTYMEGLFLPIFNEVQKGNSYEFHVIQFTWGDKSRINITNKAADLMQVRYKAVRIFRKPSVLLGSLLAILIGYFQIFKYVNKHEIDILFPRSNFPAIVVNMLRIIFKRQNIIFDADGLPIEERIENNSLARKSLMHTFLSNHEKKIITHADAVLIRSNHAVKYFSDEYDIKADKFFRVENGRNYQNYNFSSESRKAVRKTLDINEDEKLLIYVGSLGEKYAIKEMIDIFGKLKKQSDKYKFLVLTHSTDYLYSNFSSDILADIKILTIPTIDVAKYLSAADFALCLIYQSLSMSTVAATKLGEYFMAGLPVVITSRIGDNDTLFNKLPFCFLLENNTETEINKSVDWIYNYSQACDRVMIGEFGRNNFSVEKAAQSYLQALDSL